MQKDHFLLSEVARLVGIKPYSLAYLITTGVIEEPPLRINNKRIFTAKDVARIKRVVGDRQPKTRKEVHP